MLLDTDIHHVCSQRICYFVQPRTIFIYWCFTWSVWFLLEVVFVGLIFKATSDAPISDLSSRISPRMTTTASEFLKEEGRAAEDLFSDMKVQQYVVLWRMQQTI